VAHPFIEKFELHVRICEEFENEYSPQKALVDACMEITEDLNVLGKRAATEWIIYGALNQAGGKGDISRSPSTRFAASASGDSPPTILTDSGSPEYDPISPSCYRDFQNNPASSSGTIDNGDWE
jgi:hypothetical protein